MSFRLTELVLQLKNLTPVEKAVAHVLAFYSPENGEAYPSMETIALESGMGSRRAAIRVVRRLEAKGVISATASKKGGRNNPTHYRFNLVNSDPGVTLSGAGNSDPGRPNSGERVTLDARNSDRGVTRKEVKEVVASKETAAAISRNQMEAELTAAWDHYLDVFNKEEIISPSARRVGMAVLAGLREKYPTISSEDCVGAMTAAIDRERHLAKTEPKKAFFSKWFAIFSKFETFHSLWEEET